MPRIWHQQKLSIQDCQVKKKHRNPYQKTAYTLWDIELMKRELASLKTENEIFRKSGCGLKSSNDEKIAAVDKLKMNIPYISFARHWDC